MKWRVSSWHEGDPLWITLENGLRFETPWADENVAEAWEEQMVWESCEDLDKAGWLVNESDIYYNPNEDGPTDPPTRWREYETLPDWFRKVIDEETQNSGRSDS